MSRLDTAWTGAKATYVADLGRYGKVGYSELAMHTQIAGKEVVRFALWPAEDGQHVGWAHVETEDGTITDGLPGEVLPGSVRSKLGYGNEMMPREARKKNPCQSNPPRLQNKMRYPVTLLIVDVLDKKPIMGQSYGPSTLSEGIREMKGNALLFAFANIGREYAVIKVLDRDVRTLPQGTLIPADILAALTIYSVKKDARQRNPWYCGISRDEVPEVFYSRSGREAVKRDRYRKPIYGTFKTQKDAELACGRTFSPYYQVMGGKGRIIRRPDEPAVQIVRESGGRLRRREFHGLCNADAAWPHTGSADEIITRRHNPSRRLEVPEKVQSDPQFQKELAAYRKRHGMEPVEVRRVQVPDGYPKYMSAWGKAPKVFYDSSNRSSTKGKRVHEFGEGGHDKPWLVSSEERGPKFLAYVGGDFDAGGEWIEK